jgi:hypothetical protein
LIDTSGEFADTRKQVEAVWQTLETLIPPGTTHR